MINRRGRQGLPRGPHPAEHNLIQRPELIRDLASRLGLRQAHVTPTLQEGVQAVVLIDDLTRTPSALGRRASFMLDGQNGTAATASCVGLGNLPTSGVRCRITGLVASYAFETGGGVLRQIEMVLVPNFTSLANGGGIIAGAGSLTAGGAMDLDTCIGFSTGHVLPFFGRTDVPFAASWGWAAHVQAYDDTLGGLTPSQPILFHFPQGSEPVLNPGNALVFVARVPGGPTYELNVNGIFRRTGVFWREEPARA